MIYKARLHTPYEYIKTFNSVLNNQPLEYCIIQRNDNNYVAIVVYKNTRYQSEANKIFDYAFTLAVSKIYNLIATDSTKIVSNDILDFIEFVYNEFVNYLKTKYNVHIT